MEDAIIINGGKRLNGEVYISGAKNATVALIPATCMADGVVTIFDVPNISDVEALVTLLRELNIDVIEKKNHLIIDTGAIKNVTLDHEAVGKLRASYYFMGALLGRYKYVKIRMSGGCYLGPRPINLHLKGFEALGAKVDYDDGYYEISAKELIGTNIYLDFASVGATINIMMAAVFAKGRTVIENAAKEPEIIDLSTMLNKMGAKIRGAGTSEIVIDGVEHLGGCTHEIIPDRIEAGTYIIMAAAMAEKVKVKNVIPQHLESMLLKLSEMGVKMDIGLDEVVIYRSDQLNGVEVKTLPFPGFATDLQQPISALMTQAFGVSRIKDTIYPERYKHLHELSLMGAETSYDDGVISISGPTSLTGATVTATDLRCGACLVIAGLIAEGTTIIKDAYHIYRGYDGIKEKLLKLGADVK